MEHEQRQRPCPFCGHERLPILVYGGRGAHGCWEGSEVEIVCPVCGVSVYFDVDISESEEDLPDDEIFALIRARGVEKWNRRAVYYE